MTARKGGRRRTHKRPAVGDCFGVAVVTAVIEPSKVWGRRDLRVRLQCICGRMSETYEFNARKYPNTCRHA